MDFKAVAYNSLDKIASLMFNKYLHYRSFGFELEDRSKERIPKICNNLDKTSNEFLTKNFESYTNKAYFSVLGQTLLIDMDIVGIENVGKDERTWDAAFAVGLTWYAIKLVDEYIDNGNAELNQKKDFLYTLYESWSTGTNAQKGSAEEILLRNATTDLLHNGEYFTASRIKNQLSQLLHAEYGRLNTKADTRTQEGIEVYKKSAELTTRIAQEFVPEFPNNSEHFLEHQGIFGGLIDDWKDKDIDFPNGEGYTPTQKMNIIMKAAKHFTYHYTQLPGIKAKYRNTNFVALAAMFHVREFLGYKERS